ncbi:hypothetical protein QUF80_02915 [Desulfococcaceae bacterium HSG8]|nr:hypothetical protein [Desulfococcaceae bacterium HSG8]
MHKSGIADAPAYLGGIIGYIYKYPSYSLGNFGENLEITCSNGRGVYYNDFFGIFYVWGLDPGTYTLTAKAPGYADTAVTVEIGTLTVRRYMLMFPVPSSW